MDNDLKYRYIKMKGEATLERISELEDLFELNRDNAKIRQMKEDVEEYEQLVKERIVKQIQADLNAIAFKKLNSEAENLKKVILFLCENKSQYSCPFKASKFGYDKKPQSLA